MAKKWRSKKQDLHFYISCKSIDLLTVWYAISIRRCFMNFSWFFLPFFEWQKLRTVLFCTFERKKGEFSKRSVHWRIFHSTNVSEHKLWHIERIKRFHADVVLRFLESDDDGQRKSRWTLAHEDQPTHWPTNFVSDSIPFHFHLIYMQYTCDSNDTRTQHTSKMTRIVFGRNKLNGAHLLSHLRLPSSRSNRIANWGNEMRVIRRHLPLYREWNSIKSHIFLVTLLLFTAKTTIKRHHSQKKNIMRTSLTSRYRKTNSLIESHWVRFNSIRKVV